MKETKTKKTLSLGKVAYEGETANNLVELELEIKQGATCAPHLSIDLEKTEIATTLSICGGVWNAKKTDYVTCGQCRDTIAELFPDNKKIQRIIEIWERWHLNDLNAGTRKQKEYVDKHLNGNYTFERACDLLEEAGLLKDRGYKYGGAWLCEPLPVEIEAEIVKLFS